MLKCMTTMIFDLFLCVDCWPSGVYRDVPILSAQFLMSWISALVSTLTPVLDEAFSPFCFQFEEVLTVLYYTLSRSGHA